MSSMTQQQQQHHALIVCDMQPDVLQSLSRADAGTALGTVSIALDAFRYAIQKSPNPAHRILFVGLQFAEQYSDLNPTHRLYGALKRIRGARWFLSDTPGAQIEPSLLRQKCKTTTDDDDDNNDDMANVFFLWRNSHLPSKADLLAFLDGVTQASVVGIKTGYCVQGIAQVLLDCNILVNVIEDAVFDDCPDRHKAVLQHLIPLYADLTTMESLVHATVGLDSYASMIGTSVQSDSESQIIGSTTTTTQNTIMHQRECCDCGRGGHFALYAHHLLYSKNAPWRRYPLQHWYDSYFCPLGEKVLDFCDEPRFSKISMYIAGREWLDEKEKILRITNSQNNPIRLPETYVVEGKRWFSSTTSETGEFMPLEENLKQVTGPWFVKECYKNGGRAIEIFETIEECRNAAADGNKYVVQAHIQNPLLTSKGQKCHLKLYCLLQCESDAVSWTLHTYQEAFLCISPNQWSKHDLSMATQVTILRNLRLRPGQIYQEWTGWPDAYEKSKHAVAYAVEQTILQGRLKGRPGKKQFEIFSTDFMMDCSGNVWLIEFNFGPVMFDPEAKQPLTTKGLKLYQELYEKEGASVQVNYHAMIRDAIGMVFYPDDKAKQPSHWDIAGTFHGRSRN